MVSTADPKDSVGSRVDSRASAQSAQSFGTRGGRHSTVLSLCSFWIGEGCFGIDTHLVGEVVTVESYIPVPLAPQAVRGIFNLRGKPVPLVSLAAVLNIPVPVHNPAKAVTAIVLHAHDLVVGLIADRMETVSTVGCDQLSQPANAKEDADYLGFLELTSNSIRTIVSVLNPDALLKHLAALRYLKTADG
jgi:chemotaxis signal transduction protein